MGAATILGAESSAVPTWSSLPCLPAKRIHGNRVLGNCILIRLFFTSLHSSRDVDIDEVPRLQIISISIHATMYLRLSQVKIWVSFVPNIPSSRQFDNGQSLHGVTRNSRPFSRSMMHYKRYRTRTIIFFERAARSFILVFSKSVLLKCFRVPLYFLVASTSGPWTKHVSEIQSYHTDLLIVVFCALRSSCYPLRFAMESVNNSPK
ncbi:unnamed protein product [Somion occarium]|uniref:Uncharacterized protein n=1 Tax=Somion occarium TaxID=3059160 RepID=A0ABP1CS86_9APHY